ncbi:ABC transporter ATP-binding protein [Spirochaeta cellobiosiphila]|uniref:ABC transporter ATP-binding protein n=1 Tax=Spirochaeta cellobiosiphila TaxID=504483 RepID=UPI0003FD02A4|nr:ABC transporter ATP-binding protein [Spirochaeta cellobiosiphila]
MLKLLKKLFPFLKPYKGNLVIAVLFMVLLDVTEYLLPLVVKLLTDDVFVNIQMEGMVHKLIWLCSILFGAALFRGIFANIMIQQYWIIGESVVRDMRNALYDKIQNMELLSYDKMQVGDLMSRLTSDIHILRNLFAWGLEHRLRIIFITTAVFILMMLLSWKLTLLVFVIIPIFLGTILFFSGKMRRAVERQQRRLGLFVSGIQQNITGMRTVKAFSAEEEEIRKLHNLNAKLKNEETNLATLQAVFNPLILVVNGVGTLIVLLYGGYQVMMGQLSLGILLAFITYMGIMRWPISLLAPNTSLFNMALGAITRIEEIFNLPDQKHAETGSFKKEIKGAIQFEKVCFAYTEEDSVLENISFSINPGEKVMLFGLTGAGKSTLISLIPRFYYPTSGNITIDETPLQDWHRETLRRQIGFVHQETFLFSATIGDNIRYGKPTATQAEVEEAASHAQIHEFIKELPEGYNTMIGEYGVGLSGGQRQRISIARTILQDPKILILDDCTSSLDSVTEFKIQQQLKELMKGRTSIIIAQRMGAVSDVDKIIVLNRKRIEGLDSHRNLLKYNSLYRDSYYSLYQQLPQEEV